MKLKLMELRKLMNLVIIKLFKRSHRIKNNKPHVESKLKLMNKRELHEYQLGSVSFF